MWIYRDFENGWGHTGGRLALGLVCFACFYHPGWCRPSVGRRQPAAAITAKIVIGWLAANTESAFAATIASKEPIANGAVAITFVLDPPSTGCFADLAVADTANPTGCSRMTLDSDCVGSRRACRYWFFGLILYDDVVGHHLLPSATGFEHELYAMSRRKDKLTIGTHKSRAYAVEARLRLNLFFLNLSWPDLILSRGPSADKWLS